MKLLSTLFFTPMVEKLINLRDSWRPLFIVLCVSCADITNFNFVLHLLNPSRDESGVGAMIE